MVHDVVNALVVVMVAVNLYVKVVFVVAVLSMLMLLIVLLLVQLLHLLFNDLVIICGYLICGYCLCRCWWRVGEASGMGHARPKHSRNSMKQQWPWSQSMIPNLLVV